jgi:integrase
MDAITRDKSLGSDELVNVFTDLPTLEVSPAWYFPCLTVRTVLGTGARVSEIPPLKAEECLKDGVIIIRRSKRDKTREVAVSPEFRPHYDRRRAWMQTGEHFIPSPRGGPVGVRTLQRWWHEVLEELGVRPLSIHKGRHTYASQELSARRLSLQQVQHQLGHAKPEMTLGFYVHFEVRGMYDPAPPAWWEIAKGGQK